MLQLTNDANQINLLDITGKVVKTIAANTAVMELDLTNQKGFTFWGLQTQKESCFTEKIILQ